MGLAVSGGPDSLALLLLAHAAIPDGIRAATVDHGLRSDAAGEARNVAALCAELAVPHRTLRVEVAAGNMQARARTARYDALAEAFANDGIHSIATAHHADDQAETMLMRLNRGSGVSGLAGIRARGSFQAATVPSPVTLLRPLLGWRRAELARTVARAGIVAARDPSNEDDSYDRVRIRKALADADWIDPIALSRSAACLSDAEDALAAYGERVRADDVWRDDVQGITRFRFGHPRLIEMRVVTAILEGFGAQPRGSAVAAMIDSLHADGVATLGGVIARQVREAGATGRDVWEFTREGPRSNT